MSKEKNMYAAFDDGTMIGAFVDGKSVQIISPDYIAQIEKEARLDELYNLQEKINRMGMLCSDPHDQLISDKSIGQARKDILDRIKELEED